MNIAEFVKVNSPQVINEIIDGEAIIVNMENGFYYSIDKVGASIWNLIEEGNAIDQISNSIVSQYHGNANDIKNGVSKFISQLLDENLIIVVEDGNPKSTNLTTDNVAEKHDFEVPVLHKYTDMEDLLLLDPIHDVEESGWPNTNPKTD